MVYKEVFFIKKLIFTLSLSVVCSTIFHKDVLAFEENHKHVFEVSVVTTKKENYFDYKVEEPMSLEELCNKLKKDFLRVQALNKDVSLNLEKGDTVRLYGKLEVVKAKSISNKKEVKRKDVKKKMSNDMQNNVVTKNENDMKSDIKSKEVEVVKPGVIKDANENNSSKQDVEVVQHSKVKNVVDERSGDSIVSIAERLAPTKQYVFGANDVNYVDCSSFVQQVYSEYGISLPRTTYEQATVGTWTSTPKAGDLVFFNGLSHVGIYVGDDMMIDALNPSDGVGYHSISSMIGGVDGYVSINN